MARAWQENRELNKKWMATFWFTGVVLFMMELGTVVNYVEARLGELASNFLGALPAWELATWRLAESAFWNYGQLEAAFRVAPLVVLPFALLGLAMAMKGWQGFGGQ
jgi:hypothetical protein